MPQNDGQQFTVMQHAIERLQAVKDDLDKEMQQYRAANKVLQALIERNEVLKKTIITTKEAADLLCVTPRLVRDWHKAGKLAAHRYHKTNRAQLYFLINDVLKFKKTWMNCVQN